MTYSPTSNDKNLPRGNSRNYRLTVREPATGDNPSPGAIDLTGATVVFEMKKQPENNRLSPTDAPVVTKTSDNINEVEILAQAGDTLGQVLIKLRPEDTKFLQPGTYAYSVKVTTAFGDVYDVVSGRIFLKGPATAAENMTPPDC